MKTAYEMQTERVGVGGWRRPVGDPACWSWPVDAEYDVTDPWAALCRWQAGRCAMCGTTDRPLHNDHSYDDGLRRGQLCPSCNTHEGKCGWADCACVGYRRLHPAAILGVSVEHPGWCTVRVPESRDETAARMAHFHSRVSLGL